MVTRNFFCEPRQDVFPSGGVNLFAFMLGNFLTGVSPAALIL